MLLLDNNEIIKTFIYNFLFLITLKGQIVILFGRIIKWKINLVY